MIFTIRSSSRTPELALALSASDTAPRFVPQRVQNFSSGSLVEPQLGQYISHFQSRFNADLH
jgi:hypothetical protein